MRLLDESVLFLETLRNDKYLYEDDIHIGFNNQRVFYGISNKLDGIFRLPLLKWILIIFYPLLLMLYVFLSFVMLLVRIVKSKHVTLADGNYFIAATPFSKSINSRVNRHIGDACWIMNYNNNHSAYDIKSGMYVSCLQLINIKDIFASTFETIIVYVLLMQKFGPFYMLDSLNALQWFVFYRACKQIPSTSHIYFINHKDRWAFLEDKIECAHKTLIQHGTERIYCSKDEAARRGLLPVGCYYVHNIPNRYHTLNKIITLSDQETEALKNSILDCHPFFIVGGYGFDTYSLNSERFSVLIICHSGVYFDKEIEIIKSLQDLDIDIYVKNHPTQTNKGFEELARSCEFTLITEQKFPHVNLVVTYDSTLAHEYQSRGVEVLYHTFLSTEKIKEIIINRLRTTLKMRK